MRYDPPPIVCNLERPGRELRFAQCPLCPRVIEDIKRFGRSVRNPTTDDDGVVLTCERVVRT